MAERSYRIKIVRGDTQFEAEGDKAFVLSMLERFDGAKLEPPLKKEAGPSAKAPPPSGAKTLAAGRGVSASEFVRQFGFKKHTDFVLAFGYYLEQHAGLKAFTALDINNCYYEAKMENSNSSQMIIRNIRRGFVMEARGDKGAKRRYTLTQSGEEYLKKALARPKKD